VANLIELWRDRLEGMDHRDIFMLRRMAAGAADSTIDDSKRAVRGAAIMASEVVGRGITIITCSLSSTIMELFSLLRDRNISAIVCESRPLCEGYVLAGKLADIGLSVTVITDAQAGIFMEKADLALVGADSVLSDGSVVNKAGTSLMAMAALDKGRPFYVCCESFKESASEAASMELEEKDPSELGAPEMPGVGIRNIYFDITPARLIDGWISEKGIRSYGGARSLGRV